MFTVSGAWLQHLTRLRSQRKSRQLVGKVGIFLAKPTILKVTRNDLEDIMTQLFFERSRLGYE